MFFKSLYYFVTVVVLCLLPLQKSAAQATPKITRAYKKSTANAQKIIIENADIKLKIGEKNIDGVARINLAPTTYPLEKITLQATGMTVQKVLIENTPQNYTQTGDVLEISLKKVLSDSDEQLPLCSDFFEIVVHYKIPFKAKTIQKTRHFISSKSGFSFFPVAFQPYQKFQQTVEITYPPHQKSISNGSLRSTEKKDGYQKDTWQIGQPMSATHSFFMVGDLQKTIQKTTQTASKITLNQYENTQKPQVNLLPLAEKIIRFLEKKLGVAYPFKNFSIVSLNLEEIDEVDLPALAVFDRKKIYLAKHDTAQKTANEYRLFKAVARQWFGGLITARYHEENSLTEGLIDLYLKDWIVAKKGKNNVALYEANGFEKYLKDPENNSFSKYSSALKILRNKIGVKHFETVVKKIFEGYKYENFDTDTLINLVRMTTGKNERWFFEQWFSNAVAYPQINASYDFNTLSKTVTITIKQTNDWFIFPLNLTIFEGGKIKKIPLQIDAPDKSFQFNYNKIPDWISVNNAPRIFGDFTTPQGGIEEAIFAFQHATDYRDKKTALSFLLQKQIHKKVYKILLNALGISFYPLKIQILEKIDLRDKFKNRKMIEKIEALASNDKHPKVRAAAIKTLGKLVNFDYRPIFENAFFEESFDIKSNALEALYYIDSKNALKKANSLPDKVKNSIGLPLSKIYIEQKQTAQMAFIAQYITTGIYMMKDKKINELYENALIWIAEKGNLKALKNMADDMVKKGKKFQKYGFEREMIKRLQEVLKIQENAPDNRKAQINIIENAIGKFAPER